MIGAQRATSNSGGSKGLIRGGRLVPKMEAAGSFLSSELFIEIADV